MADIDKPTNKQIMAEHIASRYHDNDISYEEAVADLVQIGYDENEADNFLYGYAKAKGNSDVC